MEEKRGRGKGFFVLVAFLIVLFMMVWAFILKSLELEKPRLFGATYMTMDNPYFEVLDSSIREIIEANGDVLISRDPAQQQDKQNAMIEDLLAQGVKLIFINPADWQAITPALEACRKQGVALIDVDTEVYRTDLVDSVVLSDNYDAGVQIAHDIMQRYEGKPRIGILNHKGINSTNMRIKGVLDTFNDADYPYELVFHQMSSATQESAMAVMNQMLDQGMEFDIFIGGNDPTALGGLAALQKRGLADRVFVYGIDGSPSGKAMVSQGKMVGTSAQFPMEMGKQVAEMAYQLLDGKPIDSLVYVPVKLITKENIDQFDIYGWQ
jgi:ribose transport system substrate-binding protein